MRILALTISLGLIITNAMAQQPNPTQVIAHRGAWKNTNTPENSIASLQAAIALKCYGSEFDVHMSADQVLYVSHDHDMQGYDIEKTTSDVLNTIRLKNGETIPTLEAYLKAGMNQTATRLILEIKPSRISKERSFILAQKCTEMVKALNVENVTDYISFDFDLCKKVKELAPQAEVCYLNGEKSPQEIKDAGLSGVDYHYSVFQQKEGWLMEFNTMGLVTNVWTVNDEERMQWFIDKKIGFITTNEPELLIELLRK